MNIPKIDAPNVKPLEAERQELETQSTQALAGGIGDVPDSAEPSSPDQFSSQVDSMFDNNMMFLDVQTKVQNDSQESQTMSNIEKTDSDSKLKAVRNVRS
jgi:hypothetical protein